MTYGLAVLVILCVGVVISLIRGRRRRAREMQALRTVLRSVMDEGPEGSQGKDR